MSKKSQQAEEQKQANNGHREGTLRDDRASAPKNWPDMPSRASDIDDEPQRQGSSDVTRQQRELENSVPRTAPGSRE